jgi:succinate-acetate transporter protein
MVGIYGAHPEATKISGIVTIVFAALGLYRGAADLVAFTFKRPVLPVGHLHAG